jgi:hypothetical protein
MSSKDSFYAFLTKNTTRDDNGWGLVAVCASSMSLSRIVKVAEQGRYVQAALIR